MQEEDCLHADHDEIWVNCLLHAVVGGRRCWLYPPLSERRRNVFHVSITYLDDDSRAKDNFPRNDMDDLIAIRKEQKAAELTPPDSLKLKGTRL